jgi:hypothetical protein
MLRLLTCLIILITVLELFQQTVRAKFKLPFFVYWCQCSYSGVIFTSQAFVNPNKFKNRRLLSTAEGKLSL